MRLYPLVKTRQLKRLLHAFTQNKTKDKTNWICLDCGVEVPPEMNKAFDKYSANRNKLDPNRCQIRKTR